MLTWYSYRDVRRSVKSSAYSVMNLPPKNESVLKSITLLSNDTIGERMAGPAIRCLEMARQLSSIFRVTVVGHGVLPVGDVWGFDLVQPSKAVVRKLSEDSDVFIIQGDALTVYPFLANCRAMVIADMYCPISLEFQQSGHTLPLEQRLLIGDMVSDTTNQQLSFADRFMCASERQRDLWLGAMMTLGRVNAVRFPDSKTTSMDEVAAIVPFGFPDVWPVPAKGFLRKKFGISPDAFVMLWGGGVYEWFDPLSIIRAVAAVAKQGMDVHLVFMGVKHPNENITEHDMVGLAVALAQELEVFDSHVHFNFGWVSYYERVNFLSDADVGVSAHFDTLETRYSFRTRILDYLWASLPMVLTRGDFFAEDVSRYAMGRVMDYKDVVGWQSVLTELYHDREQLSCYKKNINTYRDQYKWSEVVKPLVSLCQNATVSPDRQYMRQRFASGGKLSLWRRVRYAYSNGGLRYIISALLRRLT